MLRKAAVLLLVGFAALPAVAQDETTDDRKQKEKNARRAEVLAALDLPKRAQALRNKGVDKAELKRAIREARQRKMKPKETKDLLEAAEDAVDENGPVDNFGAFVQKKLDEGLRGRELAAAIRDEHKARGKGKGWRPRREQPEEATGKGGSGMASEKPEKGRREKPEEAGDQRESKGDSGKGKGRDKDRDRKGKGKGGDR